MSRYGLVKLGADGISGLVDNVIEVDYDVPILRGPAQLQHYFDIPIGFVAVKLPTADDVTTTQPDVGTEWDGEKFILPELTLESPPSKPGSGLNEIS